MRDIYDDTAQHIVLSKAAQIGGTTWAILKALHACANGLNVTILENVLRGGTGRYLSDRSSRFPGFVLWLFGVWLAVCTIFSRRP